MQNSLLSWWNCARPKVGKKEEITSGKKKGKSAIEGWRLQSTLGEAGA